MLDGFENRGAKAGCAFGYYDGKELKLFHKELRGEIADHPRGDGGFGWDKIFAPEGFSGKLRSELTDEEYAVSYRDAKPIDAVREFLMAK
jgi:inosine/xanthosine triphosphate pyrophosphatase family protein